jgi:preprotein translocase subunit SecE
MDKLFNYFKGAKEELAKVVWPSRQTTINHTLMVIVISVAVALFLGAIDYFLSKLLEILIIK